MIFSTDLPNELTIYKVNNDKSLTELSTNLWERTNLNTVTINLTDGKQITDLDADVNGSIESTIVLAASIPPPTTNNNNGGGGVIVYTLLLFLILTFFRTKNRDRFYNYNFNFKSH